MDRDGEIVELEIKIREQQLTIMEVWVLTFYNVQHRCLFEHICQLKRINPQSKILESSLQKFHNYSDCLHALEQGFLLTRIGQSDKDKNKCIEPSRHFMEMAQKLIERITIKLLNEKEMYQQENKKKMKCRKCGQLKLKSQIQYWATCSSSSCGSTDFIDIIFDPAKMNRIHQIESMLKIVIQLCGQLSDCQKRLDDIKTLKKEQSEATKVSQYHAFMREIREKLGKSEAQNKERPNFQEMLEAEISFAPKQHFWQIQQMEKIRKKRLVRDNNSY